MARLTALLLTDEDIADEMSSLKMLMAAIPGVPGRDYPILSAASLSEISQRTGFQCPDNNVDGEYFADGGSESRCQMFHVCVGSSPSAFFSFLCPNGTLFNQQFFTCDWWFNVDCQLQTALVSDTTSQSVSPAVRIDTIYSAIKAANEKYESQHYRGSRAVRQTLSSELRLARRRTNHKKKQNKNIASGRRHKPRYKQKHVFFL